MRFGNLVAATVLPVLAAWPALAETDRYTLEKSGTGYVRMDRQTGEMSLCEERSGQLVCKLAADERAAFESEIDRLQGALNALDQRVAKLESGLGAKLDSALPSDEEFEKTMDYVERFMRRFIDIAKDIDPQPGSKLSDPDKT